jgi:hypothetical protein
MADSYLTSSQKLPLNDEFYRLHATFGRPIRIFKTAQQVVVATNPDNNIFFPDAPFGDQVQNVIVSGTYLARIQYAPKQDLSFLASNVAGTHVQETLKASDGIVRLKLDYSGAAYLKDAERVIMDDSTFEVFTDPRPHGLFIPNFKTFYLKRVN